MGQKLKLKRRRGKKPQLPQQPKPTQKKQKKQKGLLTSNVPGRPKADAAVSLRSGAVKRGDTVYQVKLKIYGGLIQFKIVKGVVKKAGKIATTIGSNNDVHDGFYNMNVTQEYFEGNDIIIEESRWRNAYNNWEKYAIVQTEADIEQAKTLLAEDARGFFVEAELAAKFARQGLESTIAEERYGF